MFFIAAQLPNAQVWITSMVEGSTTFFKAVHLLNIYRLSSVMFALIVAFSKPVQL